MTLRTLVVFLFRSVSFRFAEQHSFKSWLQHLHRALSNRGAAPQPRPAANPAAAHRSLYPVMDIASMRGSVPEAIERCISHVTTYGQ